MTPNSVQVSWIASASGAPILQYQTQHRAVPVTTWTDNPAGVTTGVSQQVTGLIAATSYEFRVHVYNAYGEAFSGIVAATTPTGTSDPIILDARFQNPPQTLTDGFGVVWQISPRGQVFSNSVVDGTTAQVRYLAAYGTSIHHINDTGQWYSKAQKAAPNNNAWVAVPDPLPVGRAARIGDLTRLFGVNVGSAYTLASPPSAANYLAALHYLGVRRFDAPCADATHLTNAAIEGLCADGAKGAFRVFADGYQAASVAAAQTLAATNIAQQITRVGVGAVHSFQTVGLPAGRAITTTQAQSASTGLKNAVAARVDSNGIVPTVSIDQYYLGDMTVVLNYAAAVGDTGIDWGNWSGWVANATGIALQPWGNPNGPVDIHAHTAFLAPGRRFMVNWTSANAPGFQGGAAATARAGAMIDINYMMDVIYLGGGPCCLMDMFDDTGYGLFATSALANTTTTPFEGVNLFPYPTATAVHNLTTILADQSGVALTFTPGLLGYTIVGLPADGRALLTQKADGTFILLAWNEPVIQTSASLPPADVFPTSSAVTVNFSSQVQAVRIYDPLFGTLVQQVFLPVSPATVITTCNFSLAGGLKIIQIVPGTGTGQPPTGESPDATDVTSVGPAIINSFLESWTITSGGQVAVGLVADGTTANVVELYYTYSFTPHRVYQRNSTFQWYYKIRASDPWTGPAASPILVAQPVGNIVYNPGSALPVVGSATNHITANLGAAGATGAKCNRAIWGTATGGLTLGDSPLSGHTNNAWIPNYLSDPVFQSQASGIGVTFVRMHIWTLIKDIFGLGNYPALSNLNSPDWRVIAPMTGANLNACFPGADLMLNCLYGGFEGYDFSTQGANLASCYGQIAQHLKDAGVYIKYWSPCNEVNSSGPTFTPANTASLFSQVATSLHAVDSTYVVGGGDFTFEDGPWIERMAGAGAQYLNWHSYFEEAGVQDVTDDVALNTHAVAFGNTGTGGLFDGQTGPNGLGAGANYKPQMFLTEWNFNKANGVDTRQDTYFGAVWQTVVRIHGAYSGLAGTGVWHLEPEDDHYPILSSGPNFSYKPPAYLLKACNALVPPAAGGAGDVMTMTINRSDGFGKMSALTVTDATRFATIIANRDVNLSWTGPVDLLNRVSTANLTRFDLNAANPNGLTTLNVTPTSLSSVVIPNVGVTIFAGLR